MISGVRSAQSPLSRLVLFMVCLSIAGSIAAGVYWYASDLPQQDTLQPPSNGCYMVYDPTRIPGLEAQGYWCPYYETETGGYYACCP